MGAASVRIATLGPLGVFGTYTGRPDIFVAAIMAVLAAIQGAALVIWHASTSEAQAQPNSFSAIPEFHIFVRWLILSSVNCIT
jgi:hypothetical protein